MKANDNVKGGLYITSGMLLLAIGDNYIHLLAEKIGLWQFHCIRSLMAIPIISIYAKKKGLRILPKNFTPVFYRTLLMLCAMFIYFGSLAFIPISQVGAGLFTSPIFVIFFSMLFLGERILISRILAVFIGSCGVILALDLSFYNLSAFNLIPIAAGGFYALGSIVTRQWCSEEYPSSIMFMFFCGMGLVGVVMTAFLQIIDLLQLSSGAGTFLTVPLKPIDLTTLTISLMHAIISVIGGILITMGYQKGTTSFVSVFEYSFLFFAMVWAFIVFSEVITSMAFFGIVLIIVSGLIISTGEKIKR